MANIAYVLLEDGTSHVLLETGGAILQENATAPTTVLVTNFSVQLKKLVSNFLVTPSLNVTGLTVVP